MYFVDVDIGHCNTIKLTLTELPCVHLTHLNSSDSEFNQFKKSDLDLARITLISCIDLYLYSFDNESRYTDDMFE